jgi:hypothetical protein
MATALKLGTVERFGESAPESFATRHFSPLEIAELWGLSVDTVRRLFANEPGVLQISNPRRGRRNYATMRIPEMVAARVHRKLSSV